MPFEGKCSVSGLRVVPLKKPIMTYSKYTEMLDYGESNLNDVSC